LGALFANAPDKAYLLANGAKSAPLLRKNPASKGSFSSLQPELESSGQDSNASWGNEFSQSVVGMVNSMNKGVKRCM
jgi:hypothetical protein